MSLTLLFTSLVLATRLHTALSDFTNSRLSDQTSLSTSQSASQHLSTQSQAQTAQPQTLAEQSQVKSAYTETVLVTRVIDGDTIELETGEKVRYIGIDTPETYGQSECYGREATQRNKELVLNKSVRLEKDVSETDRYGRLLRYVYVDDVFVNKQLVEAGYAQARSYPPDIRFQAVFRQAEQDAREHNRGLWGTACNY